MQKPKVLAAAGLLMVVAAFLTNHTVDRLDVRAPRKLRVETFPRQVGGWSVVAERPTPPEVAQVLRTARVVDRTYRGPTGQTVDLLLVSASQAEDIHNPRVCFPSQGYRLTQLPPVHTATATLNAMTAERDDLRQKVVWWITGGVVPHPREGGLTRRLRRLRERLAPSDEGRSLLVRLIAPDDRAGNAALRQLVTVIGPPLQALLGGPAPGGSAGRTGRPA